jgi:hypothetical protein
MASESNEVIDENEVDINSPEYRQELQKVLRLIETFFELHGKTDKYEIMTLLYYAQAAHIKCFGEGLWDLTLVKLVKFDDTFVVKEIWDNWDEIFHLRALQN